MITQVSKIPHVASKSTTPYEKTWKILFYSCVLAGSLILQKVYQFHNSPLYSNVDKGSIYDFWVSIVVACLITLVRQIISITLQSKMFNFLSERRKQNPEDAAKRVNQLCKWFFDIFYYSTSTVMGYLIIKDTNFLPSYLGGTNNGQCYNLFKGHPDVQPVKHLRLFYLIQSGTHLYTLANQIFFKYKDSKFYEYVLHHGCAFFLLWFSYMMNYTLVGIVVLLLHDPGDVVLIISRSYTDYKYRKKWLNILFYLITYLVWIYTRIITFPICCIHSCIKSSFDRDFLKEGNMFFVAQLYLAGMLVALEILHIYWLIFLSKAAISMIKEGKDRSGYDS